MDTCKSRVVIQVPPRNFSLEQKRQFYILQLVVADGKNNQLRDKIRFMSNVLHEKKSTNWHIRKNIYTYQLNRGYLEREEIRRRIRRFKESIKNVNRENNGNVATMR